MHPIERLRHVARASGAPAEDVVREAARSLAGFSDDPASLVTACRRLVDRHPATGGVWWVCARVLAAASPVEEAARCLRELAADETPAAASRALPEGARVAVVGAVDRFVELFAPRGDVEVRVVDVDGDGPYLVRTLDRIEVPAVDVRAAGLAPAVAGSDLLLLDAGAVGPEVLCARPGSWAAAAVARSAGVEVWALAGVGRVLPAGTWPAVASRLASASPTPWESEVEQVPLALVDRLAGPSGPEPVADGLRRVSAPDVPELRR